MADKRVTPLSSRVPIVDSEGNPTLEFMLKWQQQNTINNDIPVLPATPGDPTKFLSGTTPSTWLTPPDTTYGVVTASAAGLAPTLPADATKYLDGSGAWSTPAGGGGGGYTAPSIVQTAYVIGHNDTQTFSISAPTSGHTLFFVLTVYSGAVITVPSGFNQITYYKNGDVAIVGYLKVSDGTETSIGVKTTDYYGGVLFELDDLASIYTAGTALPGGTSVAATTLAPPQGTSGLLVLALAQNSGAGAVFDSAVNLIGQQNLPSSGSYHGGAVAWYTFASGTYTATWGGSPSQPTAYFITLYK